MPAGEDPAAELVADIAGSAKYRGICVETIEDVVRFECARAGRAGKPSVLRQLARKRLHEVASLYLGTPRLQSAKRALDEAFARGLPGAVEGACRGLLELHASTRERLPIARELYSGIFRRTGPPDVVADLCSALGPLAYRSMGLPRGTRYLAYDIHRDFVELTAHYLRLEGVPGGAFQRDVLVRPADETADVALLLKMYHCLEKRRPGAGFEVIASAPARHVVVSLPTRTISGRRAPFVDDYRDAIAERAAARGWPTECEALDGECYLIVHKPELPRARERAR